MKKEVKIKAEELIILENLFGKFSHRHKPDEYGAYLRTPDFIINVYWEVGALTLVTLDHKNCFNKDGHNPISFFIENVFKNRDGDLRRQGKRLIQALDFLKTKEGQHLSNTFGFETIWEEFGQHNRKDYYSAF